MVGVIVPLRIPRKECKAQVDPDGGWPVALTLTLIGQVAEEVRQAWQEDEEQTNQVLMVRVSVGLRYHLGASGHGAGLGQASTICTCQ